MPRPANRQTSCVLLYGGYGWNASLALTLTQWPVARTSSTEGLVCWKPGDRRQHDAIRSRTAAASWICLDMGAMSWDGKRTHHQQVATQPRETHRIPAHVSHNRPHRTACPSGTTSRASSCLHGRLPPQPAATQAMFHNADGVAGSPTLLPHPNLHPTHPRRRCPSARPPAWRRHPNSCPDRCSNFQLLCPPSRPGLLHNSFE